MTSTSAGRDLKSLLESIKSSEVVENRVQLLHELEELNLTEKSELDSVMGSLIMLWEDFTCLDITQCTLNKTILHLAAKYLESDMSGCIGKFLDLGVKASGWSRKHLKMTVMSTEDSPEEEHNNFFYQLLQDLLSFSSAFYLALARYPILDDKKLMASLENFIFEHLSLAKDLVSEIKNIPSLNSEVLKAAQVAVDAVIRLCRLCSHGVNWDIYHEKSKQSENIINREYAKDADSVINLTKCTVENLCELGIIAANDGGSLVSLLNASWKGVVTLLQLGKGALREKVDISCIIMTLISLATQPLRCAAATWSSSLMEKISPAEAKRIFLPVKFYLINAVRIISEYRTQAVSVYKDITLCVIMILTFRISLSKVELLTSASEVLAEVLEPTALHLLNSLLNSPQVKEENKLGIFDWLFSDETVSGSLSDATSGNGDAKSLGFIFSVSSVAINEQRTLLLGRVVLFLHLLRSSPELEDDIRLGLARTLGWLLDMLVDEDIYSSILVLTTPVVYGSSQNQQISYQPIFNSILDALKTFMLVASSSLAWYEVESFLLENIFHPHVVCCEIITELWCFVLRHAEEEMANDVIDKLSSLLRFTAAPESVLVSGSAMRKIARLLCMLVTDGSQSMVDRIYSSITVNESSDCSLSVYIALLLEGFPLNFLSEERKRIAKEKLLTEYFDFLECNENKMQGPCSSRVYGAPVFALSAGLQTLQVSISDAKMKTLKFLVAIIQKYKNSRDNFIKSQYCRLLAELLCIISNLKHMYSSTEMEGVVLELQKLFISKPAEPDNQLFLCKPNLAYFMAGLGHMELADSYDGDLNSAAIELYHMLLRERHWAFIHLAITSFGSFAAHTSCNELWRFVPEEAALSFDLDFGNEADEERFMLALKAFLEKEMACPMVKPSPNQLEILVKDARLLKEILHNSLKIDPEAILCDVMETDDEKQPSRKRKIPEGISQGMELLQSGLKIMNDGLSEWQHDQLGTAEVHEKFLTRFSQLEDVIAHLVNLADGGLGSCYGEKV